MSQTAVVDFPVIAYEGKLQEGGQYPTTRISKFASEIIYFGKAVSPLAVSDIEIGNQSVEQVDATGAIIDGVAVADTTLERLSDAGVAAAYGAYSDESSVNILRKGRIWVVSTDAVDDLSKGVFVRFQNAGGTPPTEALGSFRATADADSYEWTGGVKWVAGATIGGVEFGLLEINLP